MKNKLLKSLMFVAKSFLGWLLQNIYQAIFSTTSLVVLILSLKDDIWRSATNLLRTPIIGPPPNLLLWHLLLVLLLVPLVFSLGIKFNVWRNKSNPYNFIEYGGFSWRTYKARNGIRDFPFCIEHRVELVHKVVYSSHDKRRHDVYLCPICHDQHTKEATREKVSGAYQNAKKIAEAQFFNYGKRVK